MSNPIGHMRWAIAEGYIPAYSHGPEPQMTSHETVCLLNTSDRDAHVSITIFFSDREPAGPYRVTVPARRKNVKHWLALFDANRGSQLVVVRCKSKALIFTARTIYSALADLHSGVIVVYTS